MSLFSVEDRGQLAMVDLVWQVAYGHGPLEKAFNVYWFLLNIPCPWRGRRHIKFIETDCSTYWASVKRHI